MSNRFTLKSAVYLFLIKDNKVLLSRRFNTGWMDGKYSLISGHIDGDEPVSAAIIRETKEEADIAVKESDLTPATVIHRVSPGKDQEYIDFFFIAKKWTGNPKIMEPDKCDELAWFDIENLPKNTLPYIKIALENYENKVAFSEFGWEIIKSKQ